MYVVALLHLTPILRILKIFSVYEPDLFFRWHRSPSLLVSLFCIQLLYNFDTSATVMIQKSSRINLRAKSVLPKSHIRQTNKIKAFLAFSTKFEAICLIIWTSQSEIRIITIEKTKTMQEICPPGKKTKENSCNNQGREINLIILKSWVRASLVSLNFRVKQGVDRDILYWKEVCRYSHLI